MQLPLTGPGGREVVVVADDGASAADVAAAVRTALSYDGAVPLRAGARVGEPPAAWRPGAGAGAGAGGGLVEVRVVGGLGAGGRALLPVGTSVLGREAASPVVLDDRDASRRHARVEVAADGSVRVGDLGSTNGTTLDGTALDGTALDVTALDGTALDVTALDGTALEQAGGTVAWRPGQVLALGGLRLSVTAADGAGRAGLVGRDGVFVRPPRLAPRREPVEVVLPQPSAEREPARAPWLVALLPLLLGLVLARVTGSLTFLLFSLLSPVLLVATWLQDRRSGRRRSRRETAAHARALADARADLARAVAAEQSLRHQDAPDPAEVHATATGPGTRLWERRATDDDVLLLRVGLADQPAAVQVRRPHGPPPPGPPPSGPPPPGPGSGGRARRGARGTGVRRRPGLRRGDPADAPSRRGRLAAPSAEDVPDPTCREVPAVVGLQVLGVAGPRTELLATARWLVTQAAALHAPDDLQLVLVGDGGLDERAWGWSRHLPGARHGTTEQGATHRLAEVVALVESRRGRRGGAGAGGAGSGRAPDSPRVLVVLDGAAALRRLPGVADLLRHGPAVGVHAVCLEEQARALPEECSAVLELGDGPVLRRDGEHDLALLPDGVGAAWAEEVARALAPLRLGDGAAGLPDAVRLVDLLGPHDPAALRHGWADSTRSPTRAVLGVGADGPMSVDLQADGPHALVAGTTGAGKSELLQTLVASLAVGAPPDRLALLLVDYKGGAAFREAARLPHVVGLVTDLDPHLTRRALTSLAAELTRRERLLAAAGVPDLPSYDRAGRPLGPLPRLVIVVDELAALVAELPDFVRGLVGTAQRGRSLGVHLVLATQRPSGSVSPEVRANTGLRLALRVTDEVDSRDVVDVPDAAHLPPERPGRALLRTGHGRLSTLQVARVGGARRGSGRSVVVHDVPWSRLGEPLPAPPAGPDEQTDLAGLVEALRDAAADHPPTAPPWLPPLPDQVSLAELAGAVAPDDLSALLAGSGPTGSAVPVGLTDLPDEQARGLLEVDLEAGGHLLVVGAARSGRTTALRTLAAGLARQVGAEDAHLYVLDGGGALGALAALPHVGAVVGRDEPGRLDRLVARLGAEVAQRQSLLASGGWSDVGEQRAGSTDPLPWLVVLVDRWEALAAASEERDGGRLVDDLLRLLREGPAAGVRAVVTGDRSALVGRVSSVVDRTLLLRLADRTDAALAGLSARDLPDHQPPGRGVLTGTGVEVQVALLPGPADGPGQQAALQAVAAAAVPARPGRGPLRVDPLPAVVRRRELTGAAAAHGAGAAGPLVVALGRGGDDLRTVALDLDEQGPGLLVAGPRRSGRSTALLLVAEELRARGCELVTLLPRRSPLADLPGALARLGPEDDLALSAVLDVEAPLVVLVDDVEALTDAPVVPVLERLLRQGPGRGRAVVAAGAADVLAASFRGLAPSVRTSRLGLLLSPQTPLDGDLVGARLPTSLLGAAPPGRGVLACQGELTPLQVALP